MADNIKNTAGAKTNSFSKGMYKDTTDVYMSDGLWYNAINAINNSHYGETGSLGNEPSNKLCTEAPYTIIGHANISLTEWLIFSTNDIESEIGIFSETGCKYTKVVSDRCLNFKTTHLITGYVKENYDCTRSVYWQDNLNPDRVLNIDDVPYLLKPKNDPCDADVVVVPKVLLCDKLRLHPLIKQPCLNLKKAKGSGQLNNGSYMALIAYSENGIRLTDYSMPSAPQALWQETGIGGGLELEIIDLDTSYSEYELVILGVVTQQAIAKQIGNYSTGQSRVTIDLIPGSLETIPIKYLPLRNVVYEKSKKMFAINNYLIRTGVTTQPYINYQPQANKITTNWVSVEYDTNFYWGGGHIVGYMRDEVYSFFIRWVYNTGNRTASYHIPGRASKPTDIAPVSGPDVVDPSETKVWQVYDTATTNAASGTEADGGIIKARGEMAYWESTERYPVKPNIWKELCNEPIRHHKMPSNETNHIHNQGGDKINILGVEFSNIQHPVDASGNPIVDIVGYEILRGSREGNRTIVAKGLFTNMLEFAIDGSTRRGLIQNYPYNDLRDDPFLTNTFGVLDLTGSENGNSNSSQAQGAQGEGDAGDNGKDSSATEYSAIDNNPPTYKTEDTPKISAAAFKKNYLAFHSVEGSFVRPTLSANHIKIYTEEKGVSYGKFQLPYKHPRFKFLTDFALWSSLSVAMGMVIVDVMGKTTVSGGNELEAGVIVAKATVNASATKETGTGTWISDLIGANLLALASSGGQSINFALFEGMANLVISASYYFPKALNAIFTIIKNMSNYRDHAIQYNSHGFFKNFSTITNSAVPSGLSKSYRRKVMPNRAKYIGMHVQDFDSLYRVNNIYRTKFICLKLDTDLPHPVNIDNSKTSLQDLYKAGEKQIHVQPFVNIVRNIVQYYGAIKVDYQNQYGQLDSIVQIPTGSCFYQTKPLVGFNNKTTAIFGGDIYINRFTEKNPYCFFNSWLMGEEDGYTFDYRTVVNGPVPRYFAAFYNFEAQDFKVKFVPNPNKKKILPKLKADTPSDYYRFDQGTSLKSGKLVKRNAWFYLFYNGIRDFYTESELNMAFRDYGEQLSQKFYDVYGNSFNDVELLFRSDTIKNTTYYKYDLGLSTSKLFNNLISWGEILPADYDPLLYSTCFQYLPKRAVYSLQQQSGLKRDNWRNFLPLNKKDFKGEISTIKPLNATGSIILFEDQEPIYFTGVDELQTQGGVKVTIGDGGLFKQNYQSLANADDALGYGNSISSRAVVNTPYGMFFVSQKTGKIFQTNGQALEEISKQGLKFWFAKNLPSKLLEMYPKYPLYDNPVKGIGVQAVYDSTYELVYFTKRDYVPLKSNLRYDDPSGVPYYICDEEDPGVPLPSMEPTPSASVVSGGDSAGATEPPMLMFVAMPPETVAIIPTPEPVKTGVVCKAPLDIAFVLDTTGSMGGVIANLKASMSAIAIEAAAKSDNDYRFALVSANQGSTVLNVNHVTFAPNNIADFQAKLSPLFASGGGGEPEPTDVAIDSVLKGELGTFRSNAIKMIILLTDARPSGQDDLYGPGDKIEIQRISTLAKSLGVKIYPITTGSGVTNTSVAPDIAEVHKIYADTTGGKVNLSQNGVVGNIISDEINDIDCPTSCNLGSSLKEVKAGGKVTLTWTSGSGVSASIDQSVGSVPLNGTVDVYPTTTTTYTLSIKGAGEQKSECKIKIIVLPPPPKCPCAFDDPKCFKECNWTVSYDPKNKMWISFHSWEPTLMFSNVNHFYTILNNKFWKHNDRWDSFANFYGKDYPWEVEFPIATPNQVTTLKNVEYYMDTYKFYNDGKDFHHVLDEGFDRAIVFNSEQISGLLKLKIKAKNNPLDIIQVPVVDAVGINILFSKEENKFRFNQFWDITNDRGEFTGTKLPMWITDCNGYTKEINPQYVNYMKAMTEHKKFRHYANTLILRKNISSDNKMILKLDNLKNINSPR